MKINIMGAKVLEGTPISGTVPYHPFFKLIFDRPPEGIEFVEDYSGHDETRYENFIREFRASCFNAGIQSNEFDAFMSTKNIEGMKSLSDSLPVWCGVVPYYIGPNDWVLETEDIWLAFQPWFANNNNRHADLENSSVVKILKCLFEMDNFKGIITHTKDTLSFVNKVFGEKVFNKSAFCQQAVEICDEDIVDEKHDKDSFKILFHGSWNHTNIHFRLRGGHEMLEAFNEANSIDPRIKLTVVYDRRGIGESLASYLQSHDSIDYYDTYLSDSELHSLRLQSDCFCIPAYRLHSMSCLKSMCLGKPVICSDGWGFDEYIIDGYNGVICKGNKASWFDEKGIMREDYNVETPQKQLTENIKSAMLKMSSSEKLYNNMKKNCKSEYLAKYNINERNKVLGKLLRERFG